MKWLRQHVKGHSDEPAPTEPSEHVVPHRTIEADGTAVLALVYQAAELMRNLEDRATDTERQAQAIVLQAIEDLKLAKDRVCSVEAQQESSLAALEEANAKVQEIEDELRRSDALLAAYELRLSTVERLTSGAEERADEAEKVLMRTEDAIRLRLLNPKPAATRDFAAAA
jgi:chromosome segregation ATPase